MKCQMACLAVIVSLACASCAKRNSNFYPVTGTVIVNGEPASGATVFLRPQSNDIRSSQTIMGIVADDGTFELVCGSIGKGVPPGEYDVIIEWKQVTGQRNGRPERGPDRLKGRYASPSKSGLHVTISPGSNELDPFELVE
jgi:hypothetical protein